MLRIGNGIDYQMVRENTCETQRLQVIARWFKVSILRIINHGEVSTRGDSWHRHSQGVT